ncbi:ornithine cyclodeaminase family protein [Parafrankia elaeagni]|uniref:ornithine cyclodeaminase family protein n=1 Tax=Parafrankia elaeagni TaxID=222534 RepID=UPI000361D0FB|nr:ornithine cyclodeaminase family protein [Parafrankia elaeagni]
MSLPQYDDAQVEASVPVPAALTALRAAFIAAHEGKAMAVPKTMLQWEDLPDSGVSSAHALGAVDLVAQRLAFKYWVNTPRGAEALLTLFDTDRGAACAAMAAGALGMLRTSGTAALVTDALTAPDADRLAVLGTGRQAMHQVRAVAEVRSLNEVRIWSRDADHRRAFAERVHTELGLKVAVYDSVTETVRDVPIVTAVTRAREPFLDLDDLADGVHLNALGAILPTHRELLPGVVEAAGLIVVDDRDNARRAAAELHAADVDLDAVTTLGQLLAEGTARPAGCRLTLFKALGSGIGDLAVAGAAHAELLASPSAENQTQEG